MHPPSGCLRRILKEPKKDNECVIAQGAYADGTANDEFVQHLSE